MASRLSGKPVNLFEIVDGYETITCSCGELFCSLQCNESARAYHSVLCGRKEVEEAEEIWKFVADSK